MPTAYRHTYQGKPLRNSMYTTDADDAPPPDWKDDYAIAFGIPAEQIECEVIAWDGDPTTLPKEDEPDAIERIPEEQRPGYVKPEPPALTLLEKALDALSKDASLAPATKAALTDALKG